MNEQAILQFFAQYGITNLARDLVAAVTLKLAFHPEATDEEIVADEDGTIKHTLRRHIGWLIDFAWPFLGEYVDQAVRQSLAAVRAQLAEESPADPTRSQGQGI